MKTLIKRLFMEAGFSLSDKQTELFSKYYILINENNTDNDLTRIKGEKNFVIKHFIDSVYYTRFIKLPDSLVDIGSGAGFPGIPLKIMFPELRITLAEQRSKRIDFLSLALKELGLSGVELYPHKVTEKTFFNVDGVITRALEDAPETLKRVYHFLPAGGTVILLKGPDAAGDIESLSDENKRHFRLELNREYILPGTEYRRRILLFKKSGDRMKRTYKILKDENETHGIPVTSGENKTFREIRKASSGDMIKKSGLITIAGKKIINDYLNKHGFENSRMILPDEYVESDEHFMSIIEMFYSSGNLYIFKKSLFHEIDTVAGLSPVLVASSPEIEDWDGSIVRGCNPVIPFQDPLNVGTAVRSCAGFGISTIILAKDAANPFHPKSIRSSSGAVFNIKFFRGSSVSDIAEKLKMEKVNILALDSSGDDIANIDYPETFGLIPGLEGPGLPESLKKASVAIPLSGPVESLNASVALAIFLYEWREKSKK